MANFVCFESWMDMIDAIKSDYGEEEAGKYALAIMEYGTRGEINTKDKMVSSMITSFIKPIIDKSQKRYAACKNNGEQGGAPAKYDHNKIIELYERGLNKNQIAKEIGSSYNAVKSVIDKYESERDDEI